MRYCQKCIMPDTRPDIVFNEQGICDACISAERKNKEINWAEREKELHKVLERYRSKDGYYDCVIPVSAGKDSCFQAYTMKYKYGMNPLCVNFIPCEMTEVGRQNVQFLREMGFDLIQVSMNPKVYRELVKIGFQKLGDCCWPEHIGIFTAPIRVAVNYKIPLVIWGENSQFEYSGPANARESKTLNKGWLEEFQMLGYRIEDILDLGFKKSDLNVFFYPTDEELAAVGVTGFFLGYFIPWNGRGNMEAMKALGWHANPDGPCEGTYTDYENLDCKWVGGLHDYLKFLKYGYGRATDNACIDIRWGRMSREEGLRLAKKFEGKIPRKYLPDFLRFTGLTETQFHQTLERFTNKYLFKRTPEGKLFRDENGDVVKLDYGFAE